MLAVLSLYMLLAATFTFSKAVLLYIQPIFFIGLRMLLGGLLLLIYYLWIKRSLPIIKMAHWWLFAQITLLHIYASYVFEFIGLQTMSSAKACLLYTLSPFLTALWSYFFFKERFTRKKWIGLVIGLLGFLPILLIKSDIGSSMFLINKSELFLLLSVVASVQGWNAMKQLVMQGYSPLAVNSFGMITGGALALITAFAVEKQPFILDQSYTGLLSILFYMILLIIIANGLFYNIYGHLLRRYSTTFLSFAGFTTPLWAALYGWLLLGEKVHWSFFASMIIISAGLYLYYQEELAQTL